MSSCADVIVKKASKPSVVFFINIFQCVVNHEVDYTRTKKTTEISFNKYHYNWINIICIIIIIINACEINTSGIVTTKNS